MASSVQFQQQGARFILSMVRAYKEREQTMDWRPRKTTECHTQCQSDRNSLSEIDNRPIQVLGKTVHSSTVQPWL